MSNDLTTTPAYATEFTPVEWTTKTAKGGIVRHTAHSAISEAFAPKAARLEAAQQRDLTQLLNGQYRPVLSAIDAKMNDADKLRMYEAGVHVDRQSPKKDQMVPFCDAVAKVWSTKKDGSPLAAPAKGEKAAMLAMLRLYTETVTKSIAAPATQS